MPMKSEFAARMQEQLAKKEERFAEQTEIVRKLNARTTYRVARLEAERSMKLCERRGCAQREAEWLLTGKVWHGTGKVLANLLLE